LFNKYKDIDNKAKLIILNTFDKQIIVDIKDGVFSEALDALCSDKEMLGFSRHSEVKQYTKLRQPIKESDNCFERYAFIFKH